MNGNNSDNGYVTDIDEEIAFEARRAEQHNKFFDAISRGDVDMVTKYLEGFISFESADYSGITAVELAALRGHKEILRILFRCNEAKITQRALYYAIDSGSVSCVSFLLRRGAIPDYKSLTLAVDRYEYRMVETLIRWGATPSSNWRVYIDRWTFNDKHEEMKQLRTMKMLFEAGAQY